MQTTSKVEYWYTPNMSHKTHEEIEKELREAKKLIKLGGLYSHYKKPERLYKIIGFATQEASDKICVIYQAEYGKKLIFVRDLDSWLNSTLVNGKKITRFKQVK